MNTFGLGLVLTFTDRATRGMQNATGAFNELNNSVTAFSNANNAEAALLQISVAAGVAGNEIFRVGNSITSLFTGVIQSINNTGSTILSARSQLSTLYGDAKSGQKVLDQIKDYSAKSIFNFEDLIPSVIMLKANGIEAFDQIATSAYRASNGVEGVSQTLMDYAADLAAFNPNMHNMYGTGVQAAMGALNEYIAEGNAASLKRGASLDITQLLGEEKGKTIEERSRQVADLIEQLGMVGMTANLAGTPMQRLSNVSDVLFNLMTEISDSGVFEKYSELVEKLTDYLFSIPDEELEQMAKIIAEALVEIMTPLEYVLDLSIKAVDWLRELVKQNPEMAKMIIKGTALAGVFLLITGASLKLLSALGSLKFALSTLFGRSTMSNGFRLLGLLKNFLIYLAPIIATVALLKLAWDRNFLGMQDTTKNFIKDTLTTFKILFDAWNDYTLSEENYEKAREMGLLPLIEAVLQLKYHLGYLVSGFKKGFDAFFDQLGRILVKMGILDTETHGFTDLITKLLEKMTAPGLTDTWEKIGYVLGDAVGWLIVGVALLPTLVKAAKVILAVSKVLITVLKVIPKIFSIIKGIFTIITKIGPFLSDFIFYLQYGWYIFTSSILPAIGNFFASLGGWIARGTVWILTAIGNITIAILGAFGIVVTLPAWLVGLIVAAVAVIIALVWHFRDEIAAFLVETWWKIEALFSRILDWFKNTKIGKIVVGVISTIIKAVIKAVKAVMRVLSPIIAFVAGILSVIWNIISSLFEIIWSAIKSIAPILKSLFSLIWTLVKGLFTLIKSIVTSILGIVKSLANFIISIGKTIYYALRMVFYLVLFLFKTLWDKISEGLSWIANLFRTVFNWVYDNIISPFISAMSTVFDWLCTNVFEPIGSVVSKVFEGINKIFTGFKEVVIKVFGFVKSFICEAFEVVQKVVQPILDALTTAIEWLAEKIEWLVDKATGLADKVGGAFKWAGGKLKGAIGLATGGYVKTTGIAVLHPNEVVVNDVLTKRLGSFLADYDLAKDTSSPLVTQDIVATDDYKERDDDKNPLVPSTPVYEEDNDDSDESPMQSYVRNSTTNNNVTNNNSGGDTNNDNSVTFEQGSIIFQIDKDTDLANMSEQELNAVAEKLMRIMARKMQLKSMQTRK